MAKDMTVSEMARKGGQSRSPKKIAAARKNGRRLKNVFQRLAVAETALSKILHGPCPSGLDAGLWAMDIAATALREMKP